MLTPWVTTKQILHTALLDKRQNYKPWNKKASRISRYWRKPIILSHKRKKEMKMQMLVLAMKWIHKPKCGQKVLQKKTQPSWLEKKKITHKIFNISSMVKLRQKVQMHNFGTENSSKSWSINSIYTKAICKKTQYFTHRV